MGDLRHIHDAIIDNPDFNLTLSAKRDLRELCAWVESYRKDGKRVIAARNSEIERLTAENSRLEVFYAEAFPIINRLAYDQTPRNAGMRYDQLIAARKAMDAVSTRQDSNDG